VTSKNISIGNVECHAKIKNIRQSAALQGQVFVWHGIKLHNNNQPGLSNLLQSWTGIFCPSMCTLDNGTAKNKIPAINLCSSARLGIV